MLLEYKAPCCIVERGQVAADIRVGLGTVSQHVALLFAASQLLQRVPWKAGHKDDLDGRQRSQQGFNRLSIFRVLMFCSLVATREHGNVWKLTYKYNRR